MDCPDKDIEQIYYFRWWTFRKHIKQTPEGFVITEFLSPVGWAGKYNTINCAAAHHLHEGRWLGNPKYFDDYSIFWFRKGGNVRGYSFWAADSLWARYLVSGDDRLLKRLLPDLIANYEAWEKERRDTKGLFWQQDGLDGMEVSISGSGYSGTLSPRCARAPAFFRRPPLRPRARKFFQLPAHFAAVEYLAHFQLDGRRPRLTCATTSPFTTTATRHQIRQG